LFSLHEDYPERAGISFKRSLRKFSEHAFFGVHKKWLKENPGWSRSLDHAKIRAANKLPRRTPVTLHPKVSFKGAKSETSVKLPELALTVFRLTQKVNRT